MLFTNLVAVPRIELIVQGNFDGPVASDILGLQFTSARSTNKHIFTHIIQNLYYR